MDISKVGSLVNGKLIPVAGRSLGGGERVGDNPPRLEELKRKGPAKTSTSRIVSSGHPPVVNVAELVWGAVGPRKVAMVRRSLTISSELLHRCRMRRLTSVYLF